MNKKLLYQKAISFYQRFESDILAGKKSITIRDSSDIDFNLGSIVSACRYEDKKSFCYIKILSIKAIAFDEINDSHAIQENMDLAELKKVIRNIYPKTQNFYVITFRLLDQS